MSDCRGYQVLPPLVWEAEIDAFLDYKEPILVDWDLLEAVKDNFIDNPSVGFFFHEVKALLQNVIAAYVANEREYLSLAQPFMDQSLNLWCLTPLN